MEPDLETLEGSTYRFKLHDNTMTNEVIAAHIDCVFVPNAHQHGVQACILFRQKSVPAVIRLDRDHLVVFHLFQSACERLAKIADRVLED